MKLVKAHLKPRDTRPGRYGMTGKERDCARKLILRREVKECMN